MLFFELSQRSYKLKNAMNQKFLQYNENKCLPHKKSQ